jgi:hypothetical protein
LGFESLSLCKMPQIRLTEQESVSRILISVPLSLHPYVQQAFGNELILDFVESRSGAYAPKWTISCQYQAIGGLALPSSIAT